MPRARCTRHARNHTHGRTCGRARLAPPRCAHCVAVLAVQLRVPALGLLLHFRLLVRVLRLRELFAYALRARLPFHIRPAELHVSRIREGGQWRLERLQPVRLRRVQFTDATAHKEAKLVTHSVETIACAVLVTTVACALVVDAFPNAELSSSQSLTIEHANAVADVKALVQPFT